jgi:hypothetical protein
VRSTPGPDTPLREQGIGVYVIARRLGLDPKTVRRYADVTDPQTLIGPERHRPGQHPGPVQALPAAALRRRGHQHRPTPTPAAHPDRGRDHQNVRVQGLAADSGPLAAALVDRDAEPDVVVHNRMTSPPTSWSASAQPEPSVFGV